MAVKKAIVLAAGFGTRLRPLTVSRPKPLLPVMGEPMLGRILDMLVSWGVDDIAVNAHYLAGQIDGFVKEYADGPAGGKGVKIRISREDSILGTGGALRPLADWIGSDPFWLVNGDIVVEDLDPEPIEEAFEKSGRFAACWISDSTGPRTVEADPEGRICNWKSDDAGYPGTYTYCGVALLSPAVVGFLPPTSPASGAKGEGFCSVVEAYERAMYEKGLFVVGVQEPDASWCDAGTCDIYRELNSEPMAPSLFGDPRLDSLVSSLGWKDGETLAVYLGSRGSGRMMYKLLRSGASDPVLGVVYEEERKENANSRFAPITRFLEAHGIATPKLLADLPGSQAYATEFVGGKSLEELAGEKGADIVKLYLPAIEMLEKLRGVPVDSPDAPEFEPAFGPGLFRWERDLFERECVCGRYGFDGIPENVAAEFDLVAGELAREPPALVHRDFQSSNLLYSEDGGRMYMIDYQGMRPGPAAYDIASLLFDPYVDMDGTDRKLLLELAHADAKMVTLAAVQRLSQALGAYCRLAAAGQSRFLKYILRGLGNLHHAAHDAGLPAFAEFTHSLIGREKLKAGAV